MAKGCPKCLGILEQKEVGELKGKAVHIDQCPLCQGVWLDGGELDKILAKKIVFDSEEPEKDFRPDWTGGEMDLKEVTCPNCRVVMKRVRSAQDERVTTDYCLQCGGTWLDGGEIRLLMRGGPLRRSIQFVTDKISSAFSGLRPQNKEGRI